MIALSAASAVVVGAAIGVLAATISTAFAEWRGHRPCHLLQISLPPEMALRARFSM